MCLLNRGHRRLPQLRKCAITDYMLEYDRDGERHQLLGKYEQIRDATILIFFINSAVDKKL